MVDDLLQEVFLAAWVSLERFQGRSSLRAWLYGIARHKVEDYYRDQLRQPERVAKDKLEPDLTPTVEPPFDAFLDQERLEAKARRVPGGSFGGGTGKSSHESGAFVIPTTCVDDVVGRKDLIDDT